MKPKKSKASTSSSSSSSTKKKSAKVHTGSASKLKFVKPEERSSSPFPSGSRDRKENKDDVVSLEDCPLTFPDVLPIDHCELSKYSSILESSNLEALTVEEIDQLQLELESLLSAAAQRQLSLHHELVILDSADAKGDKTMTPKFLGLSKNSLSISKKGKTEDKSMKRFRDSLSRSKDLILPTVKPKAKMNLKLDASPSVPHEYAHESPLSPVVVHKLDVPRKFWESVEPYCAPISSEDVQFLENTLRSYDSLEKDLLQVPTLGTHYTLKWAMEDVEDQKGGKKKPSTPTQATNWSSKYGEEVSPFGPLTQRLVSALMEQGSGSDVVTDENLKVSCSEKDVISSLGITNAIQLERRIKKELEEQGLLDPDDPSQDDPNDEILRELRRCQGELKKLAGHNQQQIRRLLRVATLHIHKQELEKQLDKSDEIVIESYKRIAACRQKKKPPSKKDKDLAWKGVKDRGAIVERIRQVNH